MSATWQSKKKKERITSTQPRGPDEMQTNKPTVIRIALTTAAGGPPGCTLRPPDNLPGLLDERRRRVFVTVLGDPRIVCEGGEQYSSGIEEPISVLQYCKTDNMPSCVNAYQSTCGFVNLVTVSLLFTAYRVLDSYSNTIREKGGVL
eukprot:jgi/Botrbrau1/9042/Bobra.0376s0019.1